MPYHRAICVLNWTRKGIQLLLKLIDHLPTVSLPDNRDTHRYTVVMSWCACVLACLCAGVPCAGVPMCLVCWCACVLVCLCAWHAYVLGVPVCWCTCVLVCLCAGVPVCWCAYVLGVPVCWCTLPMCCVSVCWCAYVLGMPMCLVCLCAWCACVLVCLCAGVPCQCAVCLCWRACVQRTMEGLTWFSSLL